MTRLRRPPRSILIALALLLPALVWAQVGIFVSKPAVPCSTADARYTTPVVGQTFCFDSVQNALMVWNGSNWVRLGTDQVANVTDYGAKCDGVTDDTIAIRNAAASTLPVLVINGNLPCVTQTVTIPSTTRYITGNFGSGGRRGTLQQKAQDADIFNGQDLSNLVIEKLDFIMVAADRTASLNNAVSLTSAGTTPGGNQRITIRDVYIKNSQHRGILVQYGQWITIQNVICDTCSGGPAFFNTIDSQMVGNVINVSQLSATFSDGLSINTAQNNPTTTQHNQRIVVKDNVIRDRNNDQAILVHDCSFCTIAHNLITNGFQGIALQPVGGGTQLINNVTVVGNTFQGATTSPGGVGSAYGIAVGGDTASNIASAVTVNANVIASANQINTRPITSAGILVSGATDRLTVSGNSILAPGAGGILVTGAAVNTNINVSANNIGAVTVSGDGLTQAACVTVNGGAHTGVVQDTVCSGSTNGIRVEAGAGSTNLTLLNTVCTSSVSGNCFPSTGGTTGVATHIDSTGFIKFASSGTRIGLYNGNTPTNGQMLQGDGTSLVAVGGTGATLQLQPTGTFGVQVGAPTGGDKGAGQLNATAIYINGKLMMTASGAHLNSSVTFNTGLLNTLTADGMMIYCSDCTAAGALDQTCVGGGTGNLAVRVNGVAKCAY